jgi:hypothetical protein
VTGGAGIPVARGDGTAIDPVAPGVDPAPEITGTKVAAVTFCGFPFWKTSKSAAVRLRRTSPFRSVTTASIATTSTAILKVGGSWRPATVTTEHARTMMNTRSEVIVRLTDPNR